MPTMGNSFVMSEQVDYPSFEYQYIDLNKFSGLANIQTMEVS